MSWASSAHKRVDQAFFHKADRQAGGKAGNDVTFLNYVTFLSLKYRICDLFKPEGSAHMPLLVT